MTSRFVVTASLHDRSECDRCQQCAESAQERAERNSSMGETWVSGVSYDVHDRPVPNHSATVRRLYDTEQADFMLRELTEPEV